MPSTALPGNLINPVVNILWVGTADFAEEFEAVFDFYKDDFFI